MVRYVRDNVMRFYTSLYAKLPSSGLKVDVNTANLKGMQWLNDTANVRVHDTTKEQSMVRLIEERGVLLALLLNR
jgi:transposase